ncbi:alpha/beta fold hydrolase [Chitinophaga sp. Hz27]|uniref:alpha/beta fold hydrolase n=1 Tax=Chitinophaga sp. Hz27 TaxID=3347169 RepID=UPI0035D7FF4D
MKPHMILLHGLFGQLSNWSSVVAHFSSDYQLHIPALPIYESPTADQLSHLTTFLEDYIKTNQLENVILVGNSLGGHVAILYAARHPQNVRRLVLTGSSGLYENTNMGGFPKRNTHEYIKERVAYTFHDPAMATEEMVEEVLAITQDSRKCLTVLRAAKSAQRHYVADLLPNITSPTLLIWGVEDHITPVHVAHEFKDWLPDARLVVFAECGHVPMMEKPTAFNQVLASWLHDAQSK